MPERDPPVERDRHAEGAEDLRQQRGVLARARAARPRSPPARRRPRTDQPRGLGRDELELGALAAALQQRDRARRVDRVGVEQLALVELEEAALEVVQRGARGRRVVLGAGGEHAVLDALAVELGERRRAAGERHPAGLVGERQRHVGAGRGERLDGVVLQRLQVVEAVEEDRRLAPRGGRRAQRVERGGLVERRVEPAEALEPAPVARVQPADLVGVGAPAGVLAGPRAQRLRQALRRDAQRLELVDEPQQLAREAGACAPTPRARAAARP